jgi:hypothetical protein
LPAPTPPQPNLEPPGGTVIRHQLAPEELRKMRGSAQRYYVLDEVAKGIHDLDDAAEQERENKESWEDYWRETELKLDKAAQPGPEERAKPRGPQRQRRQ